jgi:hypothetical protein
MRARGPKALRFKTGIVGNRGRIRGRGGREMSRYCGERLHDKPGKRGFFDDQAGFWGLQVLELSHASIDRAIGNAQVRGCAPTGQAFHLILHIRGECYA